MKRYASAEEREWDALSTSDKVLTWTKENKFGVVAGRCVCVCARVGVESWLTMYVYLCVAART